MWEIVKRYPAQEGEIGKTLWQGRDAEGRRIYSLTTNAQRIVSEPTGANIAYSQKVALGR